MADGNRPCLTCVSVDEPTRARRVDFLYTSADVVIAHQIAVVYSGVLSTCHFDGGSTNAVYRRRYIVETLDFGR